jgi:hypothetical protein
MKKILTFLLMAISVQLFAQNYPITNINITLPTNPDAATANWGTGTSVFLINAVTKSDPRNGIPEEVKAGKILVTIKKDGSKICGAFTSNTAPASNFNTGTKVWSGKAAVALLGQECTLKPGDYTLCVQFFGPKFNPLSDEKCKPFSIRSEEKGTYQAPQAISPADGSTISAADAKKPVTFRWTPVVPKPANDVIYKVKVIEKRQGQSATEAMKSATPIIEKEVTNQTQLVLTSLSAFPIAKGSKYGWYVQATNKDGAPIGGNNGTSGVNVFKIIIVDPSEGCFEIDTLQYKVKCQGLDPAGRTIYNISNLILKNTGTNTGRTGLHNTPITNVITSTGFTISNLIPSAGASIVVNGSTSISFDIVGASGSNASFIVNASIPTVDPNLYCDKTIGVTFDLPICLCKDCDELHWDLNDLTHNKLSNNSYNLIGHLGVNLPIYGIEFQVQSYSYTPTPSTCSNGVTTLEESGMLLMPGTTINGSSAIQMYNIPTSGSNIYASKAVKLVSTTPLPNPLPVNLTIGLPGTLAGLALNCCDIQYKVCIKATVYYDREGCKSCTYTKCIEFNNH